MVHHDRKSNVCIFVGLIIYNLAKLHAQWSQFFQTWSVFLYVSQLRFLHQDCSLNHITSFQQYWQMLIANKPCRAIQTFYQLFFPVTWYDTVLWYYPECTVTDKCECITGSFSVWVSVWHSDRVQDLHRAPFVWCWCLSLPLRAPGLLSYPLMPVELYYIKICNKNNIPAITAGGVVWSDALIAKQCWTQTYHRSWLMHACYLWSGVRCDWWLFTPCTHSGLAETECRVVCKWDSF